MNNFQKQVSPTFVNIFRLSEILIADEILSGKANIDKDSIKNKISIAVDCLSKSRQSTIDVDVEKMCLRLQDVYGGDWQI